MILYYPTFRRICLRITLVACAVVLCSVSLRAQQQRDVQAGVIRVQVSEELAATLERTAGTRSAGGPLRTGFVALDEVNLVHKAQHMTRIFRPAGKFEAKHRRYGLHLWYEIRMDKAVGITTALAKYRGIKGIRKAEPIYKKALIGSPGNAGPVVVPLSATPATLPAGANDPQLPKQWHYDNTGQTGGTAHADINLFKAWGIETGNRNVIVAVTDGGIDNKHEDLSANIWVNAGEIPNNFKDDDNNGYVDDVNGYDFINNDGPITPSYHGTHVAGTIAAVTNNGVGVAGIAGGSGQNDGVRLMSCAIFDDGSANGADPSAMADGYVYAADNGAVISQNSWGYTDPDVWEESVLEGIDYFIAEAGKDENGNQIGLMRGGIVIFAAGNSNYNLNAYPAYYSPVLSVASTGDTDQKAFYSNFGDWVDIAAPGGVMTDATTRGVLSTLPGDRYGYYQGTSMACPHVSGVAALIVSKFGGPGFTAEALWGRLVGTADYIDGVNKGYEKNLGAGRVNAFSALQENDNNAPATVTDLTATDVKAKSITLRFTAPTDPGNAKASRYEIRYSRQPITDANFSSAIKLNDVVMAGDAEVVENIAVNGLHSASVYYFALKALDLFGNVSGISNVVQQATTALPTLQLSASTFQADLQTAQTAERDLIISNTGTGPLEFALKEGDSNADFLQLSTTTGVVAPGANTTVHLTLSARGLWEDTYMQAITVSSNDSTKSTRFIYVTLEVTNNGASIVSLSDDAYDFGSVYLNSRTRKTVEIYNEGSEPLEITGVSNAAGFTTDFSEAITLAPFTTERLVLTFSATSLGVKNGTITLTTNDPAHASVSIALSATVVAPPVIALAPGGFTQTLATGQTATQNFTIRNTGAGTLNFRVHAMPAKEEDATLRPSPTPIRVLVISLNGGVPDLATQLGKMKDLLVTTIAPEALRTLTLEALQKYHVILSTNESAWSNAVDPTSLGDLFADYVDAGGKLIVNNNAYAGGDLQLGGRFSQEGYSPFATALASTDNTVSLVDVVTPRHPLLNKVETLNYSGTIYRVGLADHARGVARWSTGEWMMATTDDVVALNLTPYSWEGDLLTIYRNAIYWLAGTPMIKTDIVEGSLAAGGEIALQAMFDATGLRTGAYLNTFYLTTNIPGKEIVTVPATLIVEGPKLTVSQDSVWEILEKGTQEQRTLTLKNDGAHAVSYAVRISEKGVATAPDNVSYETGFEDYARGSVLLSNQYWQATDDRWRIETTNPATGLQHLNLTSDGYRNSSLLSPSAYTSEQYTTVYMKVHVQGTGVVWQIVPRFLGNLTVTSVRIDDESVKVLVDNNGIQQYMPVDVARPTEYFDLTLELNKDTKELKVYINNQEVLTGKALFEQMQSVLFQAEMLEAGGSIDIDDFTIINGRKELLPHYVNASPVTGMLAAGASQAITLDFDATTIPFGSYRADIVVEAGEAEQQIVPLTTDVVGDPAVVLEGLEKVIIPFHHNAEKIYSLKNTGGAAIEYTIELHGDNTAWLTLNNTEGTIPVRGSVELTALFATETMSPGEYTLDIHILGNVQGGETIIPLQMEVQEPAGIAVQPTNLAFQAGAGRSVTRTFSLVNTGESPLEYSFEDLVLPDTWIGGGDEDRPEGKSAVVKVYATGFEEFDEDPIDEQRGWSAESTRWRIEAEEPFQGDYHLRGSTSKEGSFVAHSPEVAAGIGAYSSLVVKLMLYKEDFVHASWEVIPKSVSAGKEVTRFRINADRELLAVVKGADGKPVYKDLLMKMPDVEEYVELRIEVERATSMFTLYVNGEAKLHDQGFAGSIEQVDFQSGTERNNDQLFIDNLIILDGALPWMSVSPRAGTILGGESGEITLTLDASALSNGTYRDTLYISSNAVLAPWLEVPVTLQVTPPAVLEVGQDTLKVALEKGTVGDYTLVLKNAGVASLDYSFMGYDWAAKNSARSGRPDSTGYSWVDSDDAWGKAYTWIDISETGEAFELADFDIRPVRLPFYFPYYGEQYKKAAIYADGLIAFGPFDLNDAYDNYDIPNVEGVDNIIAPFWEDLDPSAGGMIYYQADFTQAIFQFENVPMYGSTKGNTFQVILYPDGIIKLNYKKVDPAATPTVGIENRDGRQGMQIAYGSGYLKDNLGITVTPLTPWITPSLTNGVLEEGEEESVGVRVSAENLEDGQYYSYLFVSSNDANTPMYRIPVSLTVGPLSVTGIDPEHSGAVRVYPNPSAGRFEVKVQGAGPAHVAVYNVTGQPVPLKSFGKTETGYFVEIDNPGVYILRVTGNNLLYTEKVVVR